MKHILRALLQKMIDDIDSGSCDMSEDDLEKTIAAIRKYTRRDGQWSKYQAYTFLNMSRATFDRHVREGKIPRGRKLPGYKELFWSERDIRKMVGKGK